MPIVGPNDQKEGNARLLGPGERPVVDQRAKIRAATKVENEKLRERLESAERARWFDREIDSIKVGPHVSTFDRMISNADGAPVAPESGHDGADAYSIDLAGTPRSESAGPDAVDVNPAARPEAIPAAKAKAAKPKRAGKKPRGGK